MTVVEPVVEARAPAQRSAKLRRWNKVAKDTLCFSCSDMGQGERMEYVEVR